MVDQLAVQVYPDAAAAGRSAAQQVAAWLRQILAEQDHAVVVFAAAASQNEFLAALRGINDLEWRRVVALHMDEYIGLGADAPQSFRRYLRERLFDDVRPGMVHYIDGDSLEPEAESRRYEQLLVRYPVDIVCAGIGENGHLAFNDPPVANFTDPRLVKVVELDRICRQQQVHDGSFVRIEDVPTHALTLTIPALTQARWISCVVSGSAKAEAVDWTLHGPISTACPASILRQHGGAVLSLDRGAAQLQPDEVKTF